MLFDYNLIKLHRDFAANNLDKSDFLLLHAEKVIRENIAQLEWDFKKQNNILEIGARNIDLSNALVKAGVNLTTAEFSPTMLKKNPAKNKILLENDNLNLEENTIDMIISIMNLHWVNDVRQFAKDIYQILKKDGAFIANFIGDNSFNNFKKLIIEHEEKSGIPHLPHIVPLIQAENIYRLFQEAGFKFITVAREDIKLEYGSPINLMKDLKNMGENNAMIDSARILPRSILKHQGSFEDEVTLVTLVVKKV